MFVCQNLFPDPRLLLAFLGLAALACGAAVSHGQDDWEGATLEVSVGKKAYVGTPLAWDRSQLALLRTNGRISILERQSIDSLHKVSSRFTPKSAHQMRDDLEQEFGNAYQVTIAGHFVVVHPPGEQHVWVKSFENLYLRFRSYFQARSFSLDEPEFPLVAVVLNTRGEFDRFVTKYANGERRIEGYYSPASNRVITYAGVATSDPSELQNPTLIHEATHQVAFNTGLHSRVAPTPRWISEGLAMMFEAPGVYDSQRHPDLVDRIHPERLNDFLNGLQAGDLRGKLATLVEGDDWFQSQPQQAYAYAWALSFYLMENRRPDYSRFLKSLRDKPGFTAYSDRDRRHDFEKFFGQNLNELELRLAQYLARLPTER